MTTIRTGNNRRRAKAESAARLLRRRYAALDFETFGLAPMTSEGILASNARIVYFDEGRPGSMRFVEPSNESIDEIARTIEILVGSTGWLTGLSRFADYGPEILVDRGDNANPTSVAAVTESLDAMIRKDPVLTFAGTLAPRSWEGTRSRIDFDQMAFRSALSDEELRMVDGTLAMFAKPDEGISREHAEQVSAMPSYDDFVAGLPDGIPDESEQR